MRTIDERLQRAFARRNPYGVRGTAEDELVITNETFNKVGVTVSPIERLLRVVMAPVSQDVTRKAIEAGERVKDHLSEVLTNVKFEYQGSVVANTHIRGASDIDILAVNMLSYGWDANGVKTEWSRIENTSRANQDPFMRLRKLIDATSYKGDAIADLAKQSDMCEEKLSGVYDDVDASGSKAITVINKKLNQKVDVVNCTWYDNVESTLNGQQLPYRGIRIYNRKEKMLGEG